MNIQNTSKYILNPDGDPNDISRLQIAVQVEQPEVVSINDIKSKTTQASADMLQEPVSTTVDTNESEQLDVKQLLRTANLPDNTQIVEHTNKYKSVDEFVKALTFVDDKITSQFANGVNTSILNRNGESEKFYLATITVADLITDLGEERTAKTNQVLDAIRKKKGVEFCKLEDAVIDHINDKDFKVNRYFGSKFYMLDYQDTTSDTPEKDNYMLMLNDNPCLFCRSSLNKGEISVFAPFGQDEWCGGDQIVVRLSKSASDA